MEAILYTLGHREPQKDSEQMDDMVEAVLKEEQSSSRMQAVLQSAKSRRPTETNWESIAVIEVK